MIKCILFEGKKLTFIGEIHIMIFNFHKLYMIFYEFK